MIYEVGQGGGWLGRFSTPIIRGLFDRRGHPDKRLGVSISAINETMAAQEDWDDLEELWASIDDGFALDGIKGFMKPSLKGGLFSMRPMAKKMDKWLHLEKLKCPVEVGVVTRDPRGTSKRNAKGLGYLGLSSDDAAGDIQWRKWVLGSSAIAFLMQTVEARVGGVKLDLRDGGHLYSVPWIPDDMTEVDVILHHPVDAYKSEAPPIGKNKLLSELSWLYWVHFQNGHWEALRRMRRLAEEGVEIRIWAPPEPLGGLLDGSGKTLSWRKRLGQKVLEAGPVSPLDINF